MFRKMNFGNPVFTPIQGPLGRGRPLPQITSISNVNFPVFQPEFSSFSPTSPVSLHEYDVLQMSRPIMNPHTPPPPPPPSSIPPPTFPPLPPPTTQWGPPRHMAPPAMTIGPVPMHMHAVPFDPVQNGGMSNSSPQFYPTITQVPKMDMEQFSAQCQKVEQFKDWESAFEQAAKRHGIKVKEAPKAQSGTFVHKKFGSVKICLH